jgi:hypothetical protein
VEEVIRVVRALQRPEPLVLRGTVGFARPDDRPGEDLGADRVELELEFGDNAEVPPGPADALEQVAVLVGVVSGSLAS